MSDVDHSLIYQTQKFITAANVHHVKMWLFAYQSRLLAPARRQRYEALLRDFVATQKQMLAANLKVTLEGSSLRDLDPRLL